MDSLQTFCHIKQNPHSLSCCWGMTQHLKNCAVISQPCSSHSNVLKYSHLRKSACVTGAGIVMFCLVAIISWTVVFIPILSATEDMKYFTVWQLHHVWIYLPSVGKKLRQRETSMCCLPEMSATYKAGDSGGSQVVFLSIFVVSHCCVGERWHAG